MDIIIICGAGGGILFGVALILFFCTTFLMDDGEKVKKIEIIAATIAVVGIIGICIGLFKISSDNNKEPEKDTKPKDDYYGTEQYYKDAYEYYQDNSNWNRDYGDKYGYRY